MNSRAIQTQARRINPAPIPLRWHHIPQSVHSTLVGTRLLRRQPTPSIAHSLLLMLGAAISTTRLPRPVFIIGAPRSGTTFLGQCIGSVACVDYHYEPKATKRANQHIVQRDWSDARARWTYRFVYRALHLLRDRAENYHYFSDKTPRNCFILSSLNDWFPGALFLMIVRDPRDAVASLREKPWYLVSTPVGTREDGGDLSGAYPRPWLPESEHTRFVKADDTARCAMVWKHHVGAALAQLGQVESNRKLVVRYEDILRSPSYWSDAIADFMGLTHVAHRAQLRASLAVGRCDSIGRWKHDFCDIDLKRIDAETGELAQELGYDVRMETKLGAE